MRLLAGLLAFFVFVGTAQAQEVPPGRVFAETSTTGDRFFTMAEVTFQRLMEDTARRATQEQQANLQRFKMLAVDATAVAEMKSKQLQSTQERLDLAERTITDLRELSTIEVSPAWVPFAVAGGVILGAVAGAVIATILASDGGEVDPAPAGMPR